MPEQTRRYLYHIKDIPLTPLTEKVGTRFIAGTNVLLSFIEQPPGASFPLHRHPSEPILIIIEGSEEHPADPPSQRPKAADRPIQHRASTSAIRPNCPLGWRTSNWVRYKGRGNRAHLSSG